MDVLYERCAALDIGKRSIAACLRLPRNRQTRTFGTVTRELLELADWLDANGVTHVAMEPGRAFTGSPFTTSSRATTSS